MGKVCGRWDDGQIEYILPVEGSRLIEYADKQGPEGMEETSPGMTGRESRGLPVDGRSRARGDEVELSDDPFGGP
jgi:hypothetical protein